VADKEKQDHRGQGIVRNLIIRSIRFEMKVYKLLIELLPADLSSGEETPSRYWTINDVPIDFPRAYVTYPDGEKVYWKDGKYSHRVLPNGETIYRK